MKRLFSYCGLITVFTMVFLALSCKQTETVVVNENPTAAAPSDTSAANQSSNNASFRKLIIGTYENIDSMDPLFADNASAMHINQLVYEGLVRLDSRGSVIPGLAQKWTVDSDSLTFTFSLRSDVYFQDNDAFSTGTGRKFKADDVKFVFERMARSNVPPQAARLFMNIKGFEPYFKEQHFIYNPANRSLSGVTGIKTPDDTTVVFELKQKDADLLKKLATPLAVIYPKEAVGNTVDNFAPVGTGPFTFSQMTDDSTFIFARNKNYYTASDIMLNRVDIRVSSEAQLLRSLNAGDVHLITQMGPMLLQKVVRDDGKLRPELKARYQLVQAGGRTEYVLRYNPESRLSSAAARKIGGYLQADTSFFNRFPSGWIQLKNQSGGQTSAISSADIKKPVFITYSNDPFVQAFRKSASNRLEKQDITLQTTNIRTPVNTTAFFFTRQYPLLAGAARPDSQNLFSFTVKQVALQRPEIKNLSFNQYPWWFNLRGVTIPSAENLN